MARRAVLVATGAFWADARNTFEERLRTLRMEEKASLSSVQAGMRGITVEGEVTEAKDIREFNKFGKEGKVQEVVIKDDTGTGVLTLWNEQAGTLSVGDKVRATGVYTKEFRDEVQLHISRQGSLEKI